MEPAKSEGLAKFSQALNRFSKEDPTFRVSRDEESAQTIIGGMGELHLEVYIERIRREYQVEVVVGQPQVAYREAISKPMDFDYVHKKQTGGAGQYARVMGTVEPLEEGEYEFIDKIVGGSIPKEFRGACDKGFREAMERGELIGHKIVGIRATISDGAAHAVDSSDIAFKTATLMAFREAYRKAKPVVLEPIMKVSVETPKEFSGTVLGGLNRRRGSIMSNETGATTAVIDCEVPLSEMFGYASDLRSATQGKAGFTMEFSRYAPVPSSVQADLVKSLPREEQKRRLAAISHRASLSESPPPTDSFFSLTPDHVLVAVERSGSETTGLCYALNSLENRVYEVEVLGNDRDQTLRTVAKFYRPGRWSKDTILDEHRLLAALAEAEIPVCAPQPFPDGSTLQTTPDGIHFTLFPRTGGRSPDDLIPDQYEQLGRLLARIHNVSASLDLKHRPMITPATYGRESLQTILERANMSAGIQHRYVDAVTRLVDAGEQLYEGRELFAIHGDCHRANLLFRDRFYFLDFDDMGHGPAVQDICSCFQHALLIVSSK